MTSSLPPDSHSDLVRMRGVLCRSSRRSIKPKIQVPGGDITSAQEPDRKTSLRRRMRDFVIHARRATGTPAMTAATASPDMARRTTISSTMASRAARFSTSMERARSNWPWTIRSTRRHTVRITHAQRLEMRGIGRHLGDEGRPQSPNAFDPRRQVGCQRQVAPLAAPGSVRMHPEDDLS